MDYAVSELFKGFERAFDEFNEILLEHNEKYNLTSICGERDVLYKHFLDSLYPLHLFGEGARVVEIGSGGGFPSVPLMITRKDLKFTLVESTGKKCRYLGEVVDRLGLNCEQILNIRAEDGGKHGALREKFDIATARAVAKLNTLCEYCLPFVKVGGKFIAYKGDGEEIEEAENAVKILGGKIEEIFAYELPEGYGKRRAVVIKKIKTTPAFYPRGRGLERKKPL